MPLTFSVAKIPEYKTHFPSVTRDGHECWNPITEGLAMLAMILGYQRIDADNVQEVWTRIDLYQRHIHPYFNQYDGEKVVPRYITSDEVYQHMGLSMNTSTLTKAQFDKRFMEILRRERESEQ